jgi:aminoglycoside phosphotransferase (APT) family kinase protein
MSRDAQRAGRAMSDATQVAQPVTPEALSRFLGRQAEFGGVEPAVTLDTARRAAGASSGTTLFEASDGRTVRRLVFRYDLGGAFFRQYELPPQFRTMRALRAAGFPAPEALWLDAEGEVMGQPALVMARIEGSAPSITPFQDGPLMAVSAADRHAMLLNAARVVGRLNRTAVDGGAFSHLERRGEGEHFIDREISWTLHELRAAIPPTATHPSKQAFYREVRDVLEAVAGWLIDTAPRDRTPELAHGDANITNFMYRHHDVVALLDYELTHLGLGEADLGYQLAGIQHFRLLAPPVDGVPTEEEMIASYAEARGKFADWGYAKVMGEWRLAVFAAMGMSRLPAEFEHVERAYWEAARGRLADLLPDVVGAIVK